MKRVLCMLLTLAMLATLLCGCGSKQSKGGGDNADEEVTLVIAIPAAEQKDTVKVVDAINEKLKDLLPNTKVKFLMDASMAEKWPLWMSTQKPIDIAHSGYVAVLEEEVSKKSYQGLNELVKNYAPNIQKLQSEYWYSYDNATIQGELYAIPNIQYHVNNSAALKIFKEAIPYIDMQALKNEAWSSDKTSEKFWSILTEGLEKAESNGVSCQSIASLTLINIAKRGYNFIGGENSSFCYDNSDSGKILDFYASDEFAYFCDFMKNAAQKGWVSKDILTGQWSDKLYGTKGSYINADLDTGIVAGGETETTDTLLMDDPDSKKVVTSIGENKSYWAIPFTSEHPARAMQFLDLINSEKGKDIVNLMAYGIEGEHYEVLDAEKGNIKAFEYNGQGSASVSYGLPNWMVANMMQGLYNVAPYTDANKEYAKKVYLEDYNNMEKHVLYGCNFDLTSVNSKLNQIIKNNVEYVESIYSGVVADADKKKTELSDKNKNAGYEDVLKELQKQADEYIASK